MEVEEVRSSRELGAPLGVQWLRRHLPVRGCGVNPWGSSG